MDPASFPFAFGFDTKIGNTPAASKVLKKIGTVCGFSDSVVEQYPTRTLQFLHQPIVGSANLKPWYVDWTTFFYYLICSGKQLFDIILFKLLVCYLRFWSRGHSGRSCLAKSLCYQTSAVRCTQKHGWKQAAPYQEKLLMLGVEGTLIRFKRFLDIRTCVLWFQFVFLKSTRKHHFERLPGDIFVCIVVFFEHIDDALE